MFLTQDRLRVFAAARDSGRTDVATHMANIVLAAAAEDHATNSLIRTGVGESLGWLISQGDSAAAASWTEKLDRVVRPGMPLWNQQDAAAVYRAWLKLGHLDRAKIYADAAAASKRGALSELKVISGDWSGFDANEVAGGADYMFFLATTFGVGEQELESDLAHTTDDTVRRRILWLCASTYSPFDLARDPPGGEPFPIGVEAKCADRLASLPPDPVGQDTAQEDDGAILHVAHTAAQADRPDLANALLKILLTRWSTPAAGHERLTSVETAYVAEIAAIDLRSRNAGGT
ncbi:MAG TPA: hypothetical protein VGL66_19260 [Caulobacteraceae bacterium]|jgi:hypothetical protein